MENQNPTDQELQDTSVSEIAPSKFTSDHVHKLSRYFLLFAALIGIVSSIFILYLYFTYQPPQTPLQEKKNDQTTISPAASDAVGANWKTYRNTVYKFFVNYPQSWNIGYYPSSYTPETSNIILFDKFNDESLSSTEQVTVGILVSSNKEALSLKDYIIKGGINIDYPEIIDFISRDAELNYRKKRAQQMQETTFKEFEALKDGQNRLLINTEDKVFLFYIDSLEDITTEDKQIFDQILSTFKLLNKAEAFDTSDWNVYKSKFGYQIQYPSIFKLEKYEEIDPETIFEVSMSYIEDDQIPHGGPRDGISILIEKPKNNDQNITAQEYISEYIKNSTWNPKPKAEVITVDNKEAAKMQTAGSTWSVFIFYKSKIYRISATYGSSKPDFNYDDLFYQILSTFKFLDEKETIIQGKVIEHNEGCIVDAWCYLTLDENGRKVKAVYNFGRTPSCLNTKPSIDANKIKVGDQVEVFAKYSDPKDKNTLSTCDSEVYYLHKL